MSRSYQLSQMALVWLANGGCNAGMKRAVVAALLVVVPACGRAALLDGDPSETDDATGSGNTTGPGTSVGGSSGVTTGSGPGTSVGGSTSGSMSTGSMSTGSMNGSTGTGTMTCPPFMDACTNCASLNCPEIWCGCVNNPDCLGLFQCFAGCMQDETCEQGCLTTYENGISAAALVSGCAGTTCSSVCSWGNPGFDPCEECIYTDCASEMNACLATPDCSLLYQCLTACDPLQLTCQQQCYLDYPGGVQLLETALQCIAGQCQMECN